MPEAQIGSTALPILVIPRIGGIQVTQFVIKNNFSNVFVDDFSTPLTWVLEYQEREGILNTQNFDAGLSTDEIIFFPVPDSFYANDVIWTLLPYWQIATEKIFADESIMFSVKNLHLGS